MSDPRFEEIKANYRKRALKVTLRKGRRLKTYTIPFTAFPEMKIGPRNRFVSIRIDKEFRKQGAFFTLQDGTEGSFPSDLILYYCEPSYEWSPLNQIERTLKGRMGKSRLAARVVADALAAFPSKVLRLLEENRGSRHLPEVLKLAEKAGYRLEIRLKKTPAA
jgi:hypothetical protein